MKRENVESSRIKIAQKSRQYTSHISNHFSRNSVFFYDKIHNSFNILPIPTFNISSESSFHALSFELWKVGEVQLWGGCESRCPYLG